MQVSHNFPEQLNAQKASELADVYALKQVQIISRCLFLGAPADVDILGLTLLLVNIPCKYLKSHHFIHNKQEINHTIVYYFPVWL